MTSANQYLTVLTGSVVRVLSVMSLLLTLAVCGYSADPGVSAIEMTKSAAPTVIAGNNLSYTIQLTAVNNLPNVSLSDPLPPGTTFVSIMVSPGPGTIGTWNCVPPAVGSSGTVTCTKSQMANAETVTFVIVVRVCPEVACDTVLDNAATATAGGAGPDQLVVVRNAQTTVKTQADLAISSSVSPSPVNAGDNVVYTLTVSNNGPSNSAATIVTDTLPPGFIVVSAVSTLGSCSGVGTGTVNCNLGILGAANQCATAAPVSATITIVAHVPAVTPPGIFGNQASVAGGNCLPDPAAPNNTSNINLTVVQVLAGPGGYYPASSESSTIKAGSILFYGFYTSNPGDLNSNNTRINITNTNPTRGIAVHLFFVDGSTCSVADYFLCLTASQTHSFLLSDIDPGTTGYIMAVAVDGPAGFGEGHNTGCPVSFNYLIGSANLKLAMSPRRQTDLEAESVAAEFGSPLPGCDPNKSSTVLPFNGTPNGYNRLGRVLAVSNIPSRADGNDTLLVISRIGGDMMTGAAPIGTIFGLLYDDVESSYSFNLTSNACQVKGILSNNFPRTAPRLEQVIPAGRSGWMKFWGASDIGIIGAVINRNDNILQSPNAFEGGHMLHKLTLTNTVTITIPVFPPTC